MACTAAATSTVLRSTRPTATGSRLQRLQRAHHAVEAGLAVAVVLAEDRDLLQAQRGQLLDDQRGLVVVGGAHVEHVAAERVAQRLGAGERAEERHLGWLTSGSAASEVGVPT